MRIRKPHRPENIEKVNSMIQALKNGNNLPPVVILGTDAITGSHRLAAWEAAGIEPRTVEITNETYEAACENLYGEALTIDEIWELTDFCAEIYNITKNRAVRNALKDQITY